MKYKCCGTNEQFLWSEIQKKLIVSACNIKMRLITNCLDTFTHTQPHTDLFRESPSVASSVLIIQLDIVGLVADQQAF